MRPQQGGIERLCYYLVVGVLYKLYKFVVSYVHPGMSIFIAFSFCVCLPVRSVCMLCVMPIYRYGCHTWQIDWIDVSYYGSFLRLVLVESIESRLR